MTLGVGKRQIDNSIPVAFFVFIATNKAIYYMFCTYVARSRNVSTAAVYVRHGVIIPWCPSINVR